MADERELLKVSERIVDGLFSRWSQRISSSSERIAAERQARVEFVERLLREALEGK